ncbi:MAG TPA: TAXI family TRAP transporter solute-binding subunit [Desulfobacteraceae bacterium]|nr:TAXI family TRAP transporter solute-binding subunit [Desulfobacteraceae bacterium]
MKIARMIGLWAVILIIALPSEVMAKDLPKFLYIATNPQGSLYYTFGSVLGKVLDDHSGMRARVQPSGGSSAYIPAISQGKIELGVNNTNDVRMAYLGMEPFVKSPNIRVLTVMCPLLVGMLVRNDSDIQTMQDIRGKRVASKFPAQLSITYCIGGMMAADGLSWKDVVEVPVTNIIVGVQALIENRLDVTSIAVSAAKTKEADATIPGGIRFLSINGSPEGARRMAEVFPGTYPFLLKANAPGTSGIRKDTVVQAYDVFLIASTHLSEDAGYAVVKTLYEHTADIQKGHGMLKRFEKDKMVKPNVTIPYHMGAVKFYQEVGLWTPEMDKVQADLLARAAK